MGRDCTFTVEVSEQSSLSQEGTDFLELCFGDGLINGRLLSGDTEERLQGRTWEVTSKIFASFSTVCTQDQMTVLFCAKW